MKTQRTRLGLFGGLCFLGCSALGAMELLQQHLHPKGEHHLSIEWLWDQPAVSPDITMLTHPTRWLFDFHGASLGEAIPTSSEEGVHWLMLPSGVARSIVILDNTQAPEVMVKGHAISMHWPQEAEPFDPNDLKDDGQEAPSVWEESSKPQVDPSSEPASFTEALASEQAFAVLKELKVTHLEEGGRLIALHLPQEGIDVDLITQKEYVLVLNMLGVALPQRPLLMDGYVDAIIQSLHLEPTKEGARLVLRFAPEHAFLISQEDDVLLIELIPKVQEEAFSKTTEGYQGERLSLNFQNIEVRAVLQVLADFSGFNMVTSDTVTGSMTLRLQDVPWDQALDLILKLKGLEKKQMGNVMLIAPADELAAQELATLSASQQIDDLLPLESELFQVNYAKADALASILQDESSSVLSSRGRVTVDARTNTLLIRESALRLAQIKDLLVKLDKPTRQVLIETHIVKANDDFEKALGVKFGVTGRTRRHRVNQLGIGASLSTSNDLATSSDPLDISVADRLNVSLPKTLAAGVAAGAASLGLTLARLPNDTVLDMELSALESEGLAEIVSSPRLLTADQKKAYIESGEEIPYNEKTSSGAAALAFKKAVLKLAVTPQITPDHHVILDLIINQDSRGTEVSGGVAIDKQELETQVLVADGETIVLGGIYKQTRSRQVVKVPVLGDLWLVGRFFRNKRTLNNREELLIFVTPHIIERTEGVAALAPQLSHLNTDTLK